MTFADDDGNEINFDGDFAITKQAVSFFNSDIRGDVSINFSIDNTAANRKVLNYQGPQMLNQVAWTRQRFKRIKNGNIIDYGYIIIQGDNTEELNCFYISGNSGWTNLLEKLITELDYKQYAKQITADNVSSLKSATTGVFFPLVDYCYALNKGDRRYYMGYNQVKNSSIYEYFFDLYPAFYLRSLMDEIFSQNGLKLAGNILTDVIYNAMIIPAISGIMKRNPKNEVIVSGSAFTLGATFAKYNLFNNEVKDVDDLFSSSTYTANQSGDKTIVLVGTTTSLGIDPDRAVDIAIYKNGAFYTSQSLQDTFTASPGGVGNISTDLSVKFIKVRIQMNAGDTLEIYVRSNPYVTGTPTLTLDIYINPERVGMEEYVTPDNFLPELTCLDIVKFIINRFGCIAYFDTVSRTVTINKFESFKKENALDWSKYYVSHEVTYTIAAKNNYIKISDPDSQKIKDYNRYNKVKFAEGNITTGNTLKDNQDIFIEPFSASFFDQNRTNKTWLTNIPLVNLIDDEAIVYSSITNSGGVATYTGTGYSFRVGEVVRLANSSPRDLGYFIVTSQTATTVQLGNNQFTATDTGTIYRQRLEFLTASPKILINNPNIPANYFSSNTDYTLIDKDRGQTSESTAAVPFYIKQKTNLPIDGLKGSLAYSNPTSIGGVYNDPTFMELYFSKIKSIFNNPPIRCTMILPEAEYQSYVFDKLIYLETEKLTGYFFVSTIENYVDSNTPVEVNLFML